MRFGESAKKLPKTISEQEFLKIIKAIPKKDKKLKLAFMLGFYQCMRISEVLNLRKDDVDYSRNFIHILNAKGEKDRDVYIMLPVKKGLKYLPIKGLGYSRRSLQRKIEQYSKEVLGKRITFHTLRHSGSTFYLSEKGVDIRMLQTVLGHSNINTTRIYTHITPKAQKDVFSKIWEE